MNFKDLRAIVETRKPQNKNFFFQNNELCSEVVNEEKAFLFYVEDIYNE